ncbi:hypothetical protein CB1_001123001 [Camelus ferus]|nr:hypothetical protein CB1_001123001 [Camelus ferus]
MLSKLKGQLEEMRCKLQFLGLVTQQRQGQVPGQQVNQTAVARCPRSCMRSHGAWSLEPSDLLVILNVLLPSATRRTSAP